MPTSIRLYLDENVNPEVAERLASGGFDVVTARAAGMLGASDEQHLEFAEESDRVLFTHDVNDFGVLAREWAAASRKHPGILYSRQEPPAAVARMIRDVCALYDSLDNVVIWLPVKP